MDISKSVARLRFNQDNDLCTQASLHLAFKSRINLASKTFILCCYKVYQACFISIYVIALLANLQARSLSILDVIAPIVTMVAPKAVANSRKVITDLCLATLQCCHSAISHCLQTIRQTNLRKVAIYLLDLLQY